MDPQKQDDLNAIAKSTIPETKKHNHLLIILILAILFVGSCVFGGYELWRNLTLSEENANLRTTIENLSKNTDNQQEMSDNQILEYEYADDYIPPTTYKIKLNYGTKELYVYVFNSCSAVDCDGNAFENKIILTDDEAKKIATITSKTEYDKDTLSSALSDLARDSEVMAKKEASFPFPFSS